MGTSDNTLKIDLAKQFSCLEEHHNLTQLLQSETQLLQPYWAGDMAVTQKQLQSSPVLALGLSFGLTTLQLSRNAAVLTGKILPGLVGKAEVSRSLQHPEVRTRRICEFDQDIRHVEELKERNMELVGCSKLHEKQGKLGGSRLKKGAAALQSPLLTGSSWSKILRI